jgi:hypothetical protein
MEIHDVVNDQEEVEQLEISPETIAILSAFCGSLSPKQTFTGHVEVLNCSGCDGGCYGGCNGPPG